MITRNGPILLFEVDSGDEIEGITWPETAFVPRVGETIHYWQDGSATQSIVDKPIRRDFKVIEVRHDWRFMPHGNPRTICCVELGVREMKEKVL